MAEARQMSLFGVDRSHEKETDRLYTVLLSNLSKWQPGKYAEDKPNGFKDEKFTSLSVMYLMQDAGESCTFSERRVLIKRLEAEGRCPTAW
ncbi:MULTISPECIES: hypothetical protein [Bhargavaea]|uniref:Uncharacterized protein n=1 Tax=Bhargavaea changchunensis TaxID=2134037 RepID=A0ABW2NF19_9BACL|nr:hypothetical protein [Bhargavaea sp. CC-171006]